MQLILLEKGTFHTRPDMGVGIVSRYRFASSDILEQLKADIEDQMTTYLPDLIATEIRLSQTDKVINIGIVVDDVAYTLIFNTETKTLDSL